MSTLRSKLTQKQLRFTLGVFEGLSQAEAYRRAYGANAKGVDASASRLLRNAKVKAYLEELRDESADSRVFSRQKKREILYEIGTAVIPEVKPSDRIQAIKTDNAMTGDDAPVRIEGEITLSGILSQLTKTTGLPNTTNTTK